LSKQHGTSGSLTHRFPCFQVFKTPRFPKKEFQKLSNFKPAWSSPTRFDVSAVIPDLYSPFPTTNPQNHIQKSSKSRSKFHISNANKPQIYSSNSSFPDSWIILEFSKLHGPLSIHHAQKTQHPNFTGQAQSLKVPGTLNIEPNFIASALYNMFTGQHQTFKNTRPTVHT
jgi:hypothetical protein